MSGVSWDERQSDDWLASNGRWYSRSKYPRGWSTSALPPAPDHLSGDVHNTVHAVRSRIELAAGAISDSAGSFGNGSDNDAAEAAPSASVSDSSFVTSSGGARSSSGPAQATVTSQRTHQPRLPAPPDAASRPAIASPPQQPPPPAMPAAPGRFSDDNDEPTSAGLPAMPPSPAPPAPTGNIVAGDLGSLFGAARQKIESRIEEAIDQVEGR